MKRLLVILILFCGACAHAQPTTRALEPAARLTLRSCVEIKTMARDQLGRPFKIAGLSGIAHAGDGVYWAVMDRSDKLVRLKIELDANATIAAAKVEGGLTLADRRDFEGIALGSDTAYLSEEDTPGVGQYSLVDGRRVRMLETPKVFLDGNTIVNRSFESLALSVDGKSLWTANEHALISDGSPQTQVEPFGATSRVRLVRYAVDASGHARAAEQFVYQTAGVHDLAGINTLAELVALPGAGGKMLALERSGAQDIGGKRSIQVRIFLIDVGDAEDVSELAALPPREQPLRMVQKQLLFDAKICDEDGENLEGLCLGPRLGPGRWALLGVVDDGDGPMRVSRTMVVSFELELPGTGERR